MVVNILYFIHGALLLIYGSFLSGAFAGVSFKNNKNILKFIGICAFCGAMQIVTLFALGDAAEWKLYPFTTHIPLVSFLCIAYRKQFITALASVFTAYLFCQPVKWFGIIAMHFSHSAAVEYLVRIASLAVLASIVLCFLSPYFARIYNRESRSVCLLAIMPTTYYIFDYASAVYTDLWTTNNRVAVEFLPLLLVIIYMTLAVLYSGELEDKMAAEHNAEIVRFTVEQQKKEIENIKKNEHEIRLMHHDMRLFLSTVSICLEEGNIVKAKEMLSSHIARAEDTRLKKYCNFDLINYILSDFDAKCRAAEIDFVHSVKIDRLTVDVNMFSTILSNALDNALQAQKVLPEGTRNISLLLKTTEDKLLLSVENPVDVIPRFADGLPVSAREGHGYGTQSIRYMTEKLGGKCQFTVKDNTFVFKVII